MFTVAKAPMLVYWAQTLAAGGSIRLAKIYSGDPFAKAPLAEPGLEVAEGDIFYR